MNIAIMRFLVHIFVGFSSNYKLKKLSFYDETRRKKIDSVICKIFITKVVQNKIKRYLFCFKFLKISSIYSQ